MAAQYYQAAQSPERFGVSPSSGSPSIDTSPGKRLHQTQDYDLLPVGGDGITVLRSRSGSAEGGGNSATSPRPKKIGLAALVVLTFYTVSGGPFGIEDIVRAGGPFYALLGFTLLLVWAVPEALITCELSTAMPEASGSVAWVEAAFGPWWAFQKGYMSWLSGVADNALYPILFLDCALELVTDESGATPLDWDESGGARWVLIILLTTALTYLNYRGLDVVTEVAIGICLFSLLPFAAFCVLGASQVDPARWLQAPPGGLAGVDWRLLLNTFFWFVNPLHSFSFHLSSFLLFFFLISLTHPTN